MTIALYRAEYVYRIISYLRIPSSVQMVRCSRSPCIIAQHQTTAAAARVRIMHDGSNTKTSNDIRRRARLSRYLFHLINIMLLLRSPQHVSSTKLLVQVILTSQGFARLLQYTFTCTPCSTRSTTVSRHPLFLSFMYRAGRKGEP